jgi:hypothetical protein
MRRRGGGTYRGKEIINTTAAKMIKCNHHHFLKWAPTAPRKLRDATG